MTLSELLSKAADLTARMSTESLLDLWLKTTDMSGGEIPYIRGWLMDELESRFPHVYEKWLDTEYCLDEVLAEMIWDEMKKGGHRE